MGFLIGIDGGGTKTLGIIADPPGEIVAKSSRGSGNPRVAGEVDAVEAVNEVFRDLLEKTGSDPNDIEGIVVGLAGVGREPDRRNFRSLLVEKLPEAVPDNFLRVVTDAEIALYGAVGGEEGLIVNSGTGAIVMGRDKLGNVERGDGYGYLLGDEGSGFWFGLNVIKKVLEAKDGRGRYTSLKARLIDFFDLDRVEEVVTLVYEKEKRDLVRTVAGVAPLAFEEAAKGDEVSQAIVKAGGSKLGRTAKSVIDRLDFQEKTIGIVLTGGVFSSKRRRLLLEGFESQLSRAKTNWSYWKKRFAPEVGALLKACEISRGKIIYPDGSKEKGEW